jgi:hypothetical protein
MLLIVTEHPVDDNIPSLRALRKQPDLKMRLIRMYSDAICCAAYVASWHEADEK